MRNAAFLLFALCFSQANGERETHSQHDSVGHTIEDTIFKVIETGLSAVEVLPADLPQDEPETCSISSSVKCTVSSTGRNCESLIVPMEECGLLEMTFDFKFCNNEENNVLTLFKAKTEALVEMEPLTTFDLNNLSPKGCTEFSVKKKMNTCKRFFSSSLKVEGKRGTKLDGSDYCYAWDFLRIFIKREPCEITSKVLSCKVESTGEACEDFIVPTDECSLEEAMTFKYEYCNNEDTALRFRRQKTIILVEMRDIFGLDLSDLPPGECRTFEATQPINTCKRFYSTSLKVEGWRGNGMADYCYAYDFNRTYTLRPGNQPNNNGNGNDQKCEVSSKVRCTVTGTNEDCDDIIVPFEECEEVDMTFEFEMCNYERYDNSFLLGGQKTIALVEMQNIEGLDTSILSPGQCRKYRESRKIDTCKRFFSASLKVEGRKGDVFNDYCYAYDFYRSYITRPPEDASNDDLECDITANMKCTVTETGEDCDDIVVPLDECQTDVDMTFTFEYCNRETNNDVTFFKDTRARVQDIDVPGVANSIMKPNACNREIVSRKINTCNRFFTSELLIEAKRGPKNDGSDYCFAYDFYRSYITRFERPVTGAPKNPALAPSTDDCSATAKITCTVPTTNEDCENFVVPLEECDENFELIFEFEWCNNEVDQELDFKEDKMYALIEMVPVERLNTRNLPAGDCRRRIVKREIDTCKRFFSASLQVEAKRGPLNDGSDYCYAYDFYRVFINRIDGTKQPTPANQPSPAPRQPTPVEEPRGSCDFSAAITCTVDDTGQPCDGYEVTREDCEDVDMKFVFKYCNLDPTNTVTLKDQLTIGLVEMVDVDLELESASTLIPSQCHTVETIRKIDTCKNFFSASLKVEGKRGPKMDGDDYCYGWNFYRGYIRRPDEGPQCKISADITCTYERTGESCENIIISEDECNEEDSMIFDFLYCNDEEDAQIVLKQGKALVNGATIPGLDTSPLEPDKCGSVSVERDVNTCDPSFNAELKVKGRRSGDNAFCFASDLYQSTIKRSTNKPTSLPTLSPTVRPTVAPFNCAAITADERKTRILNAINNISPEESFEDDQSPQSRARDWLIDEDTYNVFCGKPCSRSEIDGGVYQRYSLAVFYFSTNGDNDWFACGRNSALQCIPRLTNINQDRVPTTSDNQIWLSPVNECAWGGLACRLDTECLDRIEFGELNYRVPLTKKLMITSFH